MGSVGRTVGGGGPADLPLAGSYLQKVRE